MNSKDSFHREMRAATVVDVGGCRLVRRRRRGRAHGRFRLRPVRRGAGAPMPATLWRPTRQGNVYTTGVFSGTADFDPGPGTFNLTSAGAHDVFVAKYTAAGALVWARRLGGSGADGGQWRRGGRAGQRLHHGLFRARPTSTPAPAPSTSPAPARTTCSCPSWTAAATSSGPGGWAAAASTRAMAWRWTGGQRLHHRALRGTADFDPGPGTFNLTSAGSADVFVSKLDSGGNFVWARQLGGSGCRRGLWRRGGRAGNVYTTGDFQARRTSTPARHLQPHQRRLDDVFVSKLDSAGNFVWARPAGRQRHRRGHWRGGGRAGQRLHHRLLPWHGGLRPRRRDLQPHQRRLWRTCSCRSWTAPATSSGPGRTGRQPATTWALASRWTGRATSTPRGTSWHGGLRPRARHLQPHQRRLVG